MRTSQRFVVASILVFAAALTSTPGQANRPPARMPSPTLPVDAMHVVTPLTLAEASSSHMIRPLSADNGIVYEQNFGGGGAAAGILLGPFGVAANIASIKARTEKESAELAGKVPLSMLELFRTAAEANAFALAGDGTSPALTIKPVLGVASLDGENVGFGVSILVEHNPAQVKWSGRYVSELTLQLPRATLATGLSEPQLDSLRSEVLDALKSVLRLYQMDAQGNLAGDHPITFKNKFLSRRFDFSLVGDLLNDQDGWTVIRLPQSVVRLPTSRVEIAAKKT